ncbi:hypothetical protein CAEBREN_25143 [Caenorhabditis brenneri]|uniref:C2 domain-containing protein n=1 Tax=Caenorhabditis brenneri TaxID=135651 RepID=G0M7P7_CAEBE|nr:hypothetical protein CAEBREN_25143 [Caenorhabditis brenneri]
MSEIILDKDAEIRKVEAAERSLKRGPVCGIAGLRLKSSMLKNCADARADIAQGRQPRPIWDVPETTTYSAATGLYSQIRRGEGPSSRPRDKPVVPRRFPKMGVGSSDLSAIEEMSPLQSSTYSSSSEGPRMSSFRNPSGWNPQHTSTTTSFQPLLPLRPSTSSNRNNGNGGFKVPMSPSPMLCSTPRTEKMFRKNPKYGRHHGSALTLSESRDEGSSSQSSDRAVTPDPWMLEGSENRNPNKSDERIHLPAKAKVWLPEHFGLDNAFAKNKDIRGIIFLSISLCGRRLTLNIQDAAYFRKPSQSSTVTSYVSGLLFHRPSSSSSKSKPDEVYRTRYIPNSSSPSFDEIMHFTLAENCARDSLIVTIYEIEEVHGQKKRVLGCMTFPVNRILKKASVLYGDTFHHRGRRQPVEDVEICNEGFFLLNRDEGSKQNFPQRKVSSPSNILRRSCLHWIHFVCRFFRCFQPEENRKTAMSVSKEKD